MKIKMQGECEVCGTSGDWEGGLYKNQMGAYNRPEDFCAIFPVNVHQLPVGCTFSTADLEHHGIITMFVCPDCSRGHIPGVNTPTYQSHKHPLSDEEVCANTAIESDGDGGYWVECRGVRVKVERASASSRTRWFAMEPPSYEGWFTRGRTLMDIRRDVYGLVKFGDLDQNGRTYKDWS